MYSGTCYSFTGATFVYDCSFETMFCEDHSENFEFHPFDFQSVLVSCKQEGTRLTTHTEFFY